MGEFKRGVKGGVMVGRVMARGSIPMCGARRRREWREAVVRDDRCG
jgi:hypothetical protein